MHGYAKRGLALVAAASGLVLGSAAVAAADASVTGEASLSGGAGSGNVVSVPADVPVNFCGNQAVVAALRTVNNPAMCDIGANGAMVTSSTDKSGGVAAGNDVNAAAFAGGNFCGNQVAIASAKSDITGVNCTVDTSGTPESSVVAATDKSGGIISGNVVSVAAAAPFNICGNQVAGAQADDQINGTTCTIN